MGSDAARRNPLRVRDKLRFVYFPTDSIVSTLYVMENGNSADIAVRQRGHHRVALFMGGGTMPNRAVVLSSGYAYRLRGHLLSRNSTALGDVATESYMIVAALYPDTDHPDGTDGSL